MQDMGNLYFSRLKRRMFISCMTAVIGVPCLGGAFWFILNVMVPGMESQHVASSPVMTVLLFSSLIIGGMAVLLVVSLLVINSRARRVDEIFVPLGFTGSRYMIQGRQYHKNNSGRPVHIYFFRGPTLEVRIDSNVNTAFQVFKKSSIPASFARSFQKIPYQSDNPVLESLAFYPADSQWLPGFLEGHSAVQAIHDLMYDGADWAIFRRLELLPGELLLNLYQSKEWNSYPLDQSEVKNWIKQLNILADELQVANLPVAEGNLTSSRAQSRLGMDNILTKAIIVIVFGMPLCMILVFIFALLAVGNG